MTGWPAYGEGKDIGVTVRSSGQPVLEPAVDLDFDGPGVSLDILPAGRVRVNIPATAAVNYYPVINAAKYPSLQAALDALVPYSTLVLTGVHTISAPLTCAADHVRIQGPGKILAAAGSDFEFLFTATGRTDVWIEDVDFDANKANRAAGQTVRFMAAALFSCTDSGFRRCVGRNTRGYASVPAVGLALSANTRGRVEDCLVITCGDAGANSSDGIYVSGLHCRITRSLAYQCTDTGFVLEACDVSGIEDCIAVECAAGGAIANSTSGPKRANFINGLTIYNWGTANTGGLFIGITGGAAGDLIDTKVEGLLMYADLAGGFGVGPAISVSRAGATGQVVRCAIVAPIIDGATTQGILVNGNRVSISDPTITNVAAAGGGAIQFQDGTDHDVHGGRLTGGWFGVITQSTATARVRDVTFEGQTQFAFFALDTSVLTVTAPGFIGVAAMHGADVGAKVIWDVTQYVVNVPTEAALVSGVDAAAGNAVRVTLTAARVVGAPLNPSPNQSLLFTFIQDGTGGWAVTWNAVFKLTWANTGNVANARSSIAFIYDGTKWNQTAAQAPYV